jgi:hypothetical protein
VPPFFLIDVFLFGRASNLLTGHDSSPIPSHSNALHRRYTRRERRIRVSIILLLLCVLCGICPEGVQILRHQRRQYRLLCDRVETAVAPGESVMVQDLFAAIALRSMGSPAIKEQVFYVRRNHLPSILPSHREMILVATPNAFLLRALRAKGYSLTEAEWEQDIQRKPQPSVRNLQIFFAIAPDALNR